MGEFAWWLLPWAELAAAQGRAVLAYGYESAEWRHICDTARLYADAIDAGNGG